MKEKGNEDRIFKYCTQVCGGKCCYVYYENEQIAACPNLTEACSCAIYKERYEEEKEFSFNKFLPIGDKLIFLNVQCGRINDILGTGALPEEVEAQCCYAHPELLEGI